MSATIRDAWISLGSNLGPSRALMADALEMLDDGDALSLEAVSSLYRTPPWGDTDQEPFLNAVARCTTTLAPGAMLARLLDIEHRLGRRRDEGRRWGPRCIDLDLLLLGDVSSESPELTLPHPRLHERAFVLVPMVELDPEREISGHGSVSKCLEACDQGGIEQVSGPDWWKSHT